MQENGKSKDTESRKRIEECLASEIINRSEKVSKSKSFAMVCLTIALISITTVMAIINYRNDCDWRELFSSYDYVSQDGEEYNYYNSDIKGDVKNGTDNKREEEQK